MKTYIQDRKKPDDDIFVQLDLRLNHAPCYSSILSLKPPKQRERYTITN
jgi:hypothetical protein